MKRRRKENFGKKDKENTKNAAGKCITAAVFALLISSSISSCGENNDVIGPYDSSGMGRFTDNPHANFTVSDTTESTVYRTVPQTQNTHDTVKTEIPPTTPPTTAPKETTNTTAAPAKDFIDVINTKSYYEYVPYKTVFVEDDEMYDDETRVIEEGIDGYISVCIYEKYINGIFDSTWTTRNTLTEPKDRIEAVGTKASVYEKEEIITETVEKYSTIYEDCDTMEEGTTAVITQGRDSVVTRKYIVTYTHDKETSRSLVSEEITEKIDRVVLVGTKREEEEEGEGNEDDNSFGLPFIDAAHGGKDYSLTQSYGGSNNHLGLDFAVYYNDPIVAAMGGTVIAAYDEGYFSHDNILWTYGTYVVIQHDGYRTYYAHMSSRTVSVGDKVSKGEIIGYSGNTGRVSSSGTGPYAGTHLHFEIRKYYPSSGIYHTVDPKPYLPWWS